MLEIKDLHVEIEGKKILKGIDLILEKGKITALMGPNGSGKSTLANALMGHPKYKITKGSIILDKKDITDSSPDERAREGLFLSFQHPKEIPGLKISGFLRTAYNSVKSAEEQRTIVEFHTMLKKKMAELKIDPSFTKRYLNEGFSGGEKKKSEILQMSLLEPRYAILDETDSGLDVDSLRIVSEGVNKLKTKENGFLIITHYNRILKYIEPEKVIVLVDGKVVKEGGKDLAYEIEESGFEMYGKEKDKQG